MGNGFVIEFFQLDITKLLNAACLFIFVCAPFFAAVDLCALCVDVLVAA
jgi:hypothetical protein